MNAVSINDKYALDTGRIYVTGNLFLVGYGWQKGLIPLSEQAIMQAIELNDVAVAWNQEAFRWGRRAAHNLEAVTELAADTADNRAALQIAGLPEQIRGYGYIKTESAARIMDKLRSLMSCWRNPAAQSEAA